MPHLKKVADFAKRAMPRNFKNSGPKAMGTTIQMPTGGDMEPRSRSKVLPNPVRNIGRSSYNGQKHTSSLPGVKAEERSEDMGEC